MSRAEVVRRGGSEARLVRLCALAAASIFLSCGHAMVSPDQPPPKPAPPPPPDPRVQAEAISADLRALLRAESEAAWQRWTGGTGPLPAASAEGKAALGSRGSLETLQQAAAVTTDPDAKRALLLLWATLLPRAVALAAGEAPLQLERARAQLVFAAPPEGKQEHEGINAVHGDGNGVHEGANGVHGEGRTEHGERDLDRLLIDEPSDQRRHQLAEAEAVAAGALQPLALSRDAAEQRAREALGLPAWPALIEALQGRPPSELAALAERTLAATDALADRALSSIAQLNLGLPPDRVQRADLPRLLRAGAADTELAAGKGWDNARATLSGLGVDLCAPAAGTPCATGGPLPAATRLRLDLGVRLGKAARPLALLVDPPDDVRLSVRPAGGLDELRALLHESTRAAAGLRTRAQRWELAALGDGAAAEGTAWLVEALAGDPQWLRASTSLRGEPLDDVVHTEAARRLLAVRRAAALVLFEVRRREGLQTAAAAASLYRSLVQRATRAQLSEADAGRWALEADSWLRAAGALRAALLGAALATRLDPALAALANPAAIASPGSTVSALATPVSPTSPAAQTAPASPAMAASAEAAAPPWWRSEATAALLGTLWAQGRSLGAEEGAGLAAVSLTPAPLVLLVTHRLAYQAPEAPPQAQRPDYKFMQGDRRTRKKAKSKKAKQK